MVRQLSGPRLINYVGNHWSYRRAQRSGSPVHPYFPSAISIEPTTACNLRCPECPSGLRSFSRSTGNIRMDTFRKIIDQLSSDLIYLTFYFQGEPYLVPAFHEMVRYAKSHRVYVATSTNAHFMDPEKILESGIDKLIVSVDGASQETYEKYRINGDLETVKRNILALTKARGSNHKPLIDLQFVVFKHNEHEINAMKKMAAELQVDQLTFKSAQIYSDTDPNDLLPKSSRRTRYTVNNSGHLSIKSELPDKCWRMWHSCVFTWDGNVVPCCFDKDATHVMGNILETPFSQIWNGEKYQAFRKQLFSNRSEIEICRNCTEGLKK